MKNRWTALLLACVIVSTIAAGSPALAQRLYWSRNFGDVAGFFENTLGTVRTNGADFFEVYENADATLWDVAVDSASRRLYWIELGASGFEIQRGDANGCQSLPIEGFESRIALDVAGGKIYWTESPQGTEDGRIVRANLDFSSVEVVLDGLSGRPTEIGIDSVGGKMYWYESLDGEIVRSNLDGSDVEVQFEVPALREMQVDSVEQKIYWAQSSPGTFRRADFDGSNLEELAPQVHSPFVVDASTGTVYWNAIDPGGPLFSGIIKQVDLDGSNEQLVITGGEADANSLALDSSNQVITIGCGVLVPALGLRGVGILLLLILLAGSRALIRPQIRRTH